MCMMFMPPIRSARHIHGTVVGNARTVELTKKRGKLFSFSLQV